MAPCLSEDRIDAGEGARGPKLSQPVYLVFRYDDVFLRGECTARDKLDLNVTQVFVQERVPLSVGVIPSGIRESERGGVVPSGSLASDSLVMPFILANRDLIEVCQHGYCHSRAPSSRKPTEFAGRSGDDQRREIEKGRAMLEAAGVNNVSVFIPPHNTFDQGTVDALAEVGFRAISAGTSLHGVHPGNDLAFVPCVISLRGIEDVVRRCVNIRRTSFITVLFHNYDLDESDEKRAMISLTELRALLRRLKREPRVVFLTTSRAVETAPKQFNMSTFRAYSVYWHMRRLHHLRLIKRLLLFPGAYWPSRVYWRGFAILLVLDAIILCIVAAAVARLLW